MKRALLVVVAIVVAVGILFAQGKTESAKTDKTKSQVKAKESTINGEVVDVSCYLAHGDKGMGEGHKACGEACAKNGSPLGILTGDGKLYVSLMPDDHSSGPNAKLMEHVSHKVKATGIVRSKGGLNAIMISKVEMNEDIK